MMKERKIKLKESTETTEKITSKRTTHFAGIGWLHWIRIFILLFLLAMSASVITTGSVSFGYKLPNWRKFIPRSERVFTPEELLQYDGSDLTKPIYLAVLGRVYDVSAGESYYGKQGGYKFFAGRDATRSYITGCFKTHLTHDLRGLSESEIKSLDTWVDFYEKSDKYFYVGKVALPEIDPNSPIPEPCN